MSGWTEGLSSSEVCKLACISYRQLDYWCRTWRIPGIDGSSSTGSGRRRRFTVEQVDRVQRLALASKLVNLSLDEALELLNSAHLDWAALAERRTQTRQAVS